MMSIRTIIVGILAAVCGICATIGVMTLNSGEAKPVATTAIVVAKVDIDMGQKITPNLLDSIEWNSKTIPQGAFSSTAEVIDKYCTNSIVAGEVLVKGRFTDDPTTLLPRVGMRAYAIEASSASSNVGRNLVPGNRVDIIWQTSDRLKGVKDPISLRLMQNVKILAVGQVDSDLAQRQKSLTLEVKPKMDENLAFAQAYGKLTLSLRNPVDNEGVEPVELVRFPELLASLEAEKNQPATPTEKTSEGDRETLNRIGSGMRAITIQTPDESTALAGLLEPGDRVDLQLTMSKKIKVTGEYSSETLLENVEVLAVDTKVFTDDSDGEKKMSRSVTLIVTESMTRDINEARQLGKLSLTLRGIADSEMGPPRVAMSVNEFVAKHFPGFDFDTSIASAPIQIRTLRGPSVQNMPFVAQ